MFVWSSAPVSLKPLRHRRARIMRSPCTYFHLNTHFASMMQGASARGRRLKHLKLCHVRNSLRMALVTSAALSRTSSAVSKSSERSITALRVCASYILRLYVLVFSRLALESFNEFAMLTAHFQCNICSEVIGIKDRSILARGLASGNVCFQLLSCGPITLRTRVYFGPLGNARLSNLPTLMRPGTAHSTQQHEEFLAPARRHSRDMLLRAISHPPS